MNEDLMGQRLKGSLIDNYVLTYYSDFVKDNDVRIETTFEHAITYGLSLRSNASSDMLNCFRRYVRNHPQEVFEIIAQNLEPLKVRKLTLVQSRDIRFHTRRRSGRRSSVLNEPVVSERETLFIGLKMG